MNIYRQIAITSREYHESLMRWARRVLADAGIGDLEVYGQMPAPGQVQPHLVFFPYYISPEVKIQENAPGISLLRPSQGSVLLQPSWQALGEAMATALGEHFPRQERKPHVGAGRPPSGYPLIDDLPEPLADWYRQHREQWCIDGQALPPAMRWMPGLPTVTRYLILAHEPGRGANEATTATAPMSVSTLNALLTGIQVERTVEVLIPALPPPSDLLPYCAALQASVSDEQVRASLSSAMDAVREPVRVSLGLTLVYDLTNRELIQMMDALKRPMQSSLNLQIRYQTGYHVMFAPAARIHTQFGNSRTRR